MNGEKSIRDVWLVCLKNKSALEKYIYEGSDAVKKVLGLRSLYFLSFCELVSINSGILSLYVGDKKSSSKIRIISKITQTRRSKWDYQE